MTGTKTITIPAAINGVPGAYVERTGDATVFACLSTTGTFRVQIDSGEAVTITTAKVLGSPGGPKLNRVSFLNDGLSAVVAIVNYGTSPIVATDVQNQVVVTAAPTFLYTARNGSFPGSGRLTIADNALLALPRHFSIGSYFYNRVAFFIDNFTANRSLSLVALSTLGTELNCCAIIMGGLGITRYFGVEFKDVDYNLRNDSGATITLAIAEVMDTASQSLS